LSSWREELARDIAKHPRNRSRLTDFTLNESVQRILDRIVFLRVCEDREIEVENTLLAILHMWQDGREYRSILFSMNCSNNGVRFIMVFCLRRMRAKI